MSITGPEKGCSLSLGGAKTLTFQSAGGDTLGQYQVGVYADVAGHDHRESLLGARVKIVFVDFSDIGTFRIMLLHDLAVAIVDLLVVGCDSWISEVFSHRSHHHDRSVDDVIQLEERKHGVKQVVDPQSVRSDTVVGVAFTWKMGVAENDFVVMPHPAKGGEKFRTDER